MPLILGSVLIFAIDTNTSTVNASETALTECNSTQTNSFVKLENDEFWDKFRESVMKDRDKNKNNPENPNDSNHNNPPQNDVQSAEN